MPDALCVKAGSIDDKDVRNFKETKVEFYCKDRMGYSKPVEGAEQKPVSFCSFVNFSMSGLGRRDRAGVELLGRVYRS